MGGSRKRVTVGHWLKAYVHLVFSSRIDRLHELIYGERTMWKGSVDASRSIYINKPNLFGGTKADGGAQGVIDLLFGEENNARNSSLKKYLGSDVPAFRGLFSAVFVDFTWSFIITQFKPVWARVEHIYNEWDSGCWYPQKAAIKRLTGQPSEYKIRVVWQPIQERSAQTITYQLKYRVRGSGDPFVSLATNSFSGGSAPGDNGADSNPKLGGTDPVSIIFWTNPGAGQGSIPTGTRLHKHVLLQDAYEFVATKVSGDGDVVITEVVDSIPTYADINPVHMLYHISTQKRWGINWDTSLIDEPSWRAVADTLYSELFGLSAAITSNDGAEVQQKILDIINGYIKPNFATNKLELHLMRESNHAGNVLVLDQDNSELLRYAVPLDTGDLVNTVIVKYSDSNEEAKSVTDHNLAAVQSSGRIISTNKDYQWVRSLRIAKYLARRDLRVLSSPLAKQTRKVNRQIWNHVRGDVVQVDEPIIGVSGDFYRITKIQELEGGEYEVDLIQDVFAVANPTFEFPVEVPPQYDPVEVLAPGAVWLVEAPYWAVNVTLSAADLGALPVDYGYVAALVQRNLSGAYSYRYDLYQSLDDTTFNDIADGSYTATGLLTNDIGYLDKEILLNGTVDLTVDQFDESGEAFAFIFSSAGEEVVGIDLFSAADGSLTVKRGVLDTVPLQHEAGAQLVLFSPSTAVDETQRIDGDTIYYKAVPLGVGQNADVNDMQSHSIVMGNRASRPYPPGNFKINGQYYPATSVALADISWAHRDRLFQTVNLVDTQDGDYGPEADTTYTIELYAGAGISGTLLDVFDQIATNQFQINLDAYAAGTFTLVLFSVRDGIESYTAHMHTFERAGGLGIGLGDNLGGV